MCRDTNLFVELLKPHYNDALKYCRALCANRSADEAEDILQQALLQALEKLGSLKDTAKFRSWLFTIITRTFYTSERKSFWKKFLPLDNMQVPDIPEVYSREQESDNRAVLNYALSKLSAKERISILLFEVAEFSIEEITAIQNEKSLSAVKSRLSRARKKMKDVIETMEAKRNAGNFNYSKSNFLGDIQNETLKLVAQVKADE
jgi:RNA polymerase sigma-70 factor (ECF subfamily)